MAPQVVQPREPHLTTPFASLIVNDTTGTHSSERQNTKQHRDAHNQLRRMYEYRMCKAKKLTMRIEKGLIRVLNTCKGKSLKNCGKQNFNKVNQVLP